MFIDSDIAWDPPDLLRVLSYNVPLVAGVYPRKSENLSFTVRFGDPRMVEADRRTGLIVAKQVGAGFLRIRRDCLEQMIGAYENLRYQPPPISGEAEARYSLFDTSIDGEEFLGEDYTFCNRWRAIGGTVWVDPDVNLRHYGSKPFSGVLRQVLRASGDATQDEFASPIGAAQTQSKRR
jgi:hypothetical protein